MSISLLRTREHFRSPRFSLAEETFLTPDGEVTRPVIHHPGAVGIIAQPTVRTVVLVRQYRYAVRRWTLEIPAGTRVAGEAPETTAARELIEEAGFAAERMRELTRFCPAVGVSDEELILYRAEGLRAVPTAPEHGELVGPVTVAIADVPAMLRRRDPFDAKTLIAFALLGIDMPANLVDVR